MSSAVAFAALVWGCVLLVLAAFAYCAYAIARDTVLAADATSRS